MVEVRLEFTESLQPYRPELKLNDHWPRNTCMREKEVRSLKLHKRRMLPSSWELSPYASKRRAHEFLFKTSRCVHSQLWPNRLTTEWQDTTMLRDASFPAFRCREGI